MFGPVQSQWITSQAFILPYYRALQVSCHSHSCQHAVHLRLRGLLCTLWKSYLQRDGVWQLICKAPYQSCLEAKDTSQSSGRFRNLERGVQPLARKAQPKILGLPSPLLARKCPSWVSRSNLGLVKCLEISKKLIRECVTVPGCRCCIPLLYNHLMDSCS